MMYSIKRFSILPSKESLKENRRLNNFIGATSHGQMRALLEGRDPKEVKGIQHIIPSIGSIKAKYAPTKKNWEANKELYKKAKKHGYIDDDYTNINGGYMIAKYK